MPTSSPTPKPPVAMKAQRMTLDAVVTGPRHEPWTMLVYGPEGVGKSKLVEDLSDSITIDTEQSANRLNTKKFPTPLTLQDVYDAIAVLYGQDHPYRRLVIDTVDRLEALIFAHVCEEAKRRPGGASIRGIEDFGYGKGYQVALDEWRRLVARLDELRTSRRMDVLLIGHAFVKRFQNPDGPDYDRYTLRLHEKAAGFLKEWAEAVLFARFEESTTKMEGSARVKGILSGERVLHTVRSAAFDAKNRFNLPEQLPLNWRELEKAMQEGLQ